MISSSQLGAGYALVTVPPNNNPDTGGGPIRKSPLVALPAHAGNTIYRTPHLVVREAEPGANWPGDLTKMMFLPDGRLVPAKPYAYDMMNGALEIPKLRAQVNLRSTIGASITMVLGAGAGMAIGPKEHRIASTIVGAVVGGVLGWIFR